MGRSDKVALIGLTIVTLMGSAFVRGRVYELYFVQLSIQQWFVAAAGWCIATYGPVLAAMILWKSATRSRIPRLRHLLLLPTHYGLLVVGNKLMLSTQYLPDFDSTMGAPIMPALLTIIMTISVYCLSLGVVHTAGTRSQPNGS